MLFPSISKLPAFSIENTKLIKYTYNSYIVYNTRFVTSLPLYQISITSIFTLLEDLIVY